MKQIKTLSELQEEDDLIHFKISDFTTSTGTPARVHNLSGGIEVNRDIFFKLDKQIQYFILKWCFYKKPDLTDSETDTLAMADYLLKGYSKRDFIKHFPKLFGYHNPAYSRYATDRIEGILDHIRA